ncbi:hypothetical protein L1987_61038 [Smallanthus sonchifolius]|uniref:Uncharacterized protein n=1 Tax=Smallanthus sonchifolius TaxID=185202 RepID=A0ACB9DA17_9ASTR|nr:hypothetical protein L1987_61038 [Smallanthus sonchifolius]
MKEASSQPFVPAMDEPSLSFRDIPLSPDPKSYPLHNMACSDVVDDTESEALVGEASSQPFVPAMDDPSLSFRDIPLSPDPKSYSLHNMACSDVVDDTESEALIDDPSDETSDVLLGHTPLRYVGFDQKIFVPEIFSETVNKVDFSSAPFKVFTDSKAVVAESTIVATNAVAKRLTFPGSGEGKLGFWNKGTFACAVCDDDDGLGV